MTDTLKLLQEFRDKRVKELLSNEDINPSTVSEYLQKNIPLSSSELYEIARLYEKEWNNY